MKYLVICLLATVATATAHAFEVKPCSQEFTLPEDSGYGELRCISQVVQGHHLEISTISRPWEHRIKIDDQPVKSVRFDNNATIGSLNFSIFFVDLETVALQNSGTTTFFRISSLLTLSDHTTVDLRYKDLLSSFYVVNENSEQWSPATSEALEMFSVDEDSIVFGGQGGNGGLKIQPRIDAEWVLKEYQQMAFLDAAKTRFEMSGKLNCETGMKPFIQSKKSCLKKAQDEYDLAVAAIKARQAQSYTAAFEETALGKYYTTENPRFDLVIRVKEASKGLQMANQFLMIRNSTGGKNARLELGFENPYLQVIK